MKFEDQMRDLARSIFQYHADNPDSVDWDGRDRVAHFCDETTLLLVADVLAAARFRVKCESVGDNPAWLRKSIDALDAHYKEGDR